MENIDKIKDFDKEAIQAAQEKIAEERKKKQTDEAANVLRGIYDKRDVAEFTATQSAKELKAIDSELTAINKLAK